MPSAAPSPAEQVRRAVYSRATLLCFVGMCFITAYDRIYHPELRPVTGVVALIVAGAAYLLVSSSRVTLQQTEYAIALFVFAGVQTDVIDALEVGKIGVRAYLSFVLLLAVWYSVLPLRLAAPFAAVVYLGFMALVLSLPHAVGADLGSLIYLGVVAVVMGVLTHFNSHLGLRERQKEAFQQQALTDTLTGLPNRRSMTQTLEALWQERDSRPPFAVVMVDIDHFKRVNDTYGHVVGDKTLRAAAQVLTRLSGPDNQVARWGGEEFMLLFPDTTAARAYEQIGELSGRVFTLGDNLPDLTFSAGAALSHEVGSLDALFDVLDKRLHAAKDGGRNRVKWDTLPPV